MILDTIGNCKKYYALGEGLKKAFVFLKEKPLEELLTGKHVIDGASVFALVQDYETKQASEGIFERHEKYIDVQYVVSGSELIGYAPLEDQEVVSEYNDAHDCAFHKGEASFVKVDAGMFAIFFPGDLHMPGISDGAVKVRKIVMKVKI